MIIGSKLLNTINPIRLKAPQGMMFVIQSIHVANAGSDVANNLFVLDYLVEDQVGQITPSDWISSVRLLTTGHNEFVNDLHHQCKYISILTDANVPNCRVTIHGRLINASRTQLLIEWYRKGR